MPPPSGESPALQSRPAPVLIARSRGIATGLKNAASSAEAGMPWESAHLILSTGKAWGKELPLEDGASSISHPRGRRAPRCVTRSSDQESARGAPRSRMPREITEPLMRSDIRRCSGRPSVAIVRSLTSTARRASEPGPSHPTRSRSARQIPPEEYFPLCRNLPARGESAPATCRGLDLGRSTAPSRSYRYPKIIA